MKLWPRKYAYDAFVIHDVSDRETITRALCYNLEKAGIRIWYSGKDLTVGCILHEEIMKGLAKSRYGIVILSRNSISSNWLAIELYELLARAINSRQKTVLPVLHCISMAELQNLIIVPNNIWSITSTCTDIDTASERLIREIKSPPSTLNEWIRENSYALRFWTLVATLILSVCGAYLYYCSLCPPQSFVKERIHARTQDFENKIKKEYAVTTSGAQSVLMKTIAPVYADFMNLRSYYRNEYEFTNGYRNIRSRKNVEAALSIDLTALSPHNDYNLYKPKIFYAHNKSNDKLHSASFFLLNTKPVSYHITNEELADDGIYEVEVEYTDNLRYMEVNLFYPTARDVPKRHYVSLKGFLPREKLIFQKTGGIWKLKSIE